MEFAGVFIGDVKQSGSTVAVVWRYTDTQPFAHGSFMRVAVSTNGGANFPLIQDPHGGYEAEFFCENMRLAVDGPYLYALWGASTNGSTLGAPPELFFARSTDNGVSFDAPIRLSKPGQEYTASCGAWSALAARGSNVYVMNSSANQVLFHAFWCGDRYARSVDGGQTFRPAAHLGTCWTEPYWDSPPQAAVANEHAFLFTSNAPTAPSGSAT